MSERKPKGKLEIAVEKINAIHMYGFGLGLTDEELGMLDSDEVEVLGQGRYGRIFCVKRGEGGGKEGVSSDEKHGA